ncbi:hypothetical protein GCM10027056_05090 [Glaciibacter psychrotolerans]
MTRLRGFRGAAVSDPVRDVAGADIEVRCSEIQVRGRPVLASIRHRMQRGSSADWGVAAYGIL